LSIRAVTDLECFPVEKDLIIVLKDGRVAEQGSHWELLRDPNGVYSDMWRQQSQEYISSSEVSEDVASEDTAKGR
jgi:ABC-type glutathione transport system ATPase component